MERSVFGSVTGKQRSHGKSYGNREKEWTVLCTSYERKVVLCSKPFLRTQESGDSGKQKLEGFLN